MPLCFWFFRAAPGARVSVDVDDLLAELGGLHLGAGEALPLDGDLADIDGGLGAELHAAQAADAVLAEDGLAALQPDVPPGAKLHAGAAADAVLIGGELLHPLGVGLAQALAHELEGGLLGRALLTALAGLHRRGDLGSLLVDALLGGLGAGGREGQLVGHEPDGGGVVGDPGPVVQAHDLVDLP